VRARSRVQHKRDCGRQARSRSGRRSGASDDGPHGFSAVTTGRRRSVARHRGHSRAAEPSVRAHSVGIPWGYRLRSIAFGASIAGRQLVRISRRIVPPRGALAVGERSRYAVSRSLFKSLLVEQRGRDGGRAEPAMDGRACEQLVAPRDGARLRPPVAGPPPGRMRLEPNVSWRRRTRSAALHTGVFPPLGGPAARPVKRRTSIRCGGR
jgi:hypothetical protein